MHGSKYVTNQSMHGSQYMTDTPTWERCCLQSSSIHLDDEDQEAPWLQNPWCKDAVASLREIWTKAKLSPVTIWVNNHFTSSCITFDSP